MHSYYSSKIKKDKVPRYIFGFFFVSCIFLGISILIGIISNIFKPSLYHNYIKVFTDPSLLSSTVVFIQIYILTITSQIAIAIIFTIYVISVPNWVKILCVTPYAMGVVAPAFAVYVFFSSAVGPFNLNILGTKYGAYFVISFLDCWQWLGVLLIGCLYKVEQIPYEHFEQAKLEGISRYKRWLYITWPEIRMIFLLYATVRLIDWVRNVDVIKAFFGFKGGPAHSVDTFGTHIIELYFQAGNIGYASLLSVFQIFVLLLLLMLMIKLFFFKGM